jgi:hypothetical protein
VNRRRTSPWPTRLPLSLLVVGCANAPPIPEYDPPANTGGAPSAPISPVGADLRMPEPPPADASLSEVPDTSAEVPDTTADTSADAGVADVPDTSSGLIEVPDTSTDASTDAAADALAPPPPGASNLARVFLLAGQSNMVGFGRTSELPAELARPRTRVQIHAEGRVDGDLAGQWGTLAPGYGTTLDRFGPELSFGLRLEAATPERDIRLIKHATSSSSLWDEWNPETGAEYGAFRDHVARALAELRALGKTPEIVGLIWMQGEADALDRAHAEAYADNLAAFVARVRVDFEVENLPVVVGLVSTAPEWPFHDTVRGAQSRTADALPQIEPVETSDLMRDFGHGDQYHYATEGQRMLGERFAQAWERATPANYDQAADFSLVNGERNWTAHSYDGAAATPMTPADDHLQGRTPATQVGPGYAHPDVDAADITWRAPATGTLHVEGEVSDADPTCGDGALVVITAAGRTVWGPFPVGPDAGEPVPFALDLPLRSQEGVVFRTESLGNADCDRTAWRLSAGFVWAD